MILNYDDVKEKPETLRAIAIIYRLWNFSTHPSEKFIVINNYFYRRIESC